MSGSLAALLDAGAARHPAAPFVVTKHYNISYGDAAETVARMRGALAARGVQPGSRVLLLAPNGAAFVFGWLALAGLDATMIPVHDQLPDEGIARIVSDAGAGFAIGTEPLLGARAGGLAGIEPAHLMGLADPPLHRDAAGLDVATAEHPCAILYTSGTTGPPKGVVLSHGAYLSAAAVMASGIGVTPEDRILTALPLFHANPQFYAVATALHAGASVALLERLSPSTFFDDALALGATGFTYVGTVLAMLARATEPARDHGMRFCVGGGAPAPLWDQFEDRRGIRVHELYGATETGSFITLNTFEASRRGSCGRVRPDMEIEILDAEDRPVPVGERGEIAVRPLRPSVIFDGYHGRPDLTLARSRNWWFHTGDGGSLDADGYLYFGGRLDNRIRRGGENVDPESVEEVLATHPDVREVAVVAVPDEVMGQEIKAVFVADPAFDPRSLTTFLDGRLPRLAWPRYVEVRETMPKTPTEKIALDELRRSNGSTVDLRAKAGAR
jgi:crotonobetaine/carnitine-CoA ligase